MKKSRIIVTTSRPKSDGPLAFSYMRFSRTHQRKGRSLARQTEARDKYLQRTGLRLDTSLDLKDLGVSGFHGRNRTHGALKAFLDAIESNYVRKGDLLLLENLDRLTREDVSEAVQLFLGIINKGIKIVTLEPFDEFEKGSLDMTKLILAVLTLGRANEESQRKSDLIKDVEKKKREQREAGKAVGGQHPAWVKRKGDKYVLLPEAKAIIVRIFRMCLEGHGQWTIARTLNNEGVPCISKRGNHWSYSYVKRILTSRQVIGEHQQYVGDKATRRPVGKPIKNLLPAVIDNDTFDRAQAAMKARATRKGPIGKSMANLFTSLLRHAVDGTTMTMIDKGKRSSGAALVSTGARQGLKGSKYVAINYSIFEQVFLAYTTELSTSDILPPRNDQADIYSQINRAEAEVVRIDTKIDVLKEQVLTTNGEVQSLTELLVDLELQRKAERDLIDELKQDINAYQLDPLRETQSIIELLRSTTDENQLLDLRAKLKDAIARLISGITLNPQRQQSKLLLKVVVKYRSGMQREYSYLTIRNNFQWATGDSMAWKKRGKQGLSIKISPDAEAGKEVIDATADLLEALLGHAPDKQKVRKAMIGERLRVKQKGN